MQDIDIDFPCCNVSVSIGDNCRAWVIVLGQSVDIDIWLSSSYKFGWPLAEFNKLKAAYEVFRFKWFNLVLTYTRII